MNDQPAGRLQAERRLRASYNGKDYVYYVLYFDLEHPEADPQRSADMTEEKVRELHAAGEWPEILDIDKPLLEARDAAARRLVQT